MLLRLYTIMQPFYVVLAHKFPTLFCELDNGTFGF